MQDAEGDLSPLMHEALNWVLCLTSGSATQADARAFEAWRAQGVDHASAFREAAALRATLRAMPLMVAGLEGQIRDTVVPFARPARSVAVNRRTMLVGSGTAIAASAAMLAINPPLGLWPSFAELNAGERTGIGERRSLRPMAGVTLEMNGRTAISLDAARSNARLVAGEAFASVTSDAHPLLVSAGDESWTIQGADANIRTSERETCITCLRGKLIRADRSITLQSGQQYVVLTGASPRIAPMDVSRSGSWRRGVLLFRQTPLAEVVEDINRYRGGKIILADASLSDRPVSGMFHTDKIGNAPQQIQQLLDLKVTELPGDIIIFS